MWSSADFSGYGGGSDAGGGFLSGAVATASKKNLGQNCIMPCTCAEVTLVGVIRSVNLSPTRIDYEIDDYTGPYLQVKLFLDDEDSTPEATKVKSLDRLSYVRVNGYVRSFQGVRNIVALKVVPLVEMNEITGHILETIYARMLQAKTKASGTDSMMRSTGDVSIPVTAGGLSVLQNQVLVSVRTYPDERGISVAQICEKLRGIPEQQIREDLDFLSAEGHVYSTIDDDHFRATEA
ncbi:DNA-directed RNA polymerase I subunit rpa2 [Sparganum proliferum]